jgi:inner membrane protein
VTGRRASKNEVAISHTVEFWIQSVDAVLTDIGLRSAGTVVSLSCLVPILAIDYFFEHTSPNLLTLAILDHLAHVLTALIVMIAISRYFDHWYGVGILIGTVVIDVDHIPLLLETTDFTSVEGRPATHSAVTLLVLLAIVIVTRKRRLSLLSSVIAGIVIGVAAHFFRDMATGGIPLFWPISDSSIEVRYAGYIAALVIVAAIPLLRSRFPGTKPRTTERSGRSSSR